MAVASGVPVRPKNLAIAACSMVDGWAHTENQYWRVNSKTHKRLDVRTVASKYDVHYETGNSRPIWSIHLALVLYSSQLVPPICPLPVINPIIVKDMFPLYLEQISEMMPTWAMPGTRRHYRGLEINDTGR